MAHTTTIPEFIDTLWTLADAEYDVVVELLRSDWESGGAALAGIRGYEFRSADEAAMERYWQRGPALEALYEETHTRVPYRETDTARQPAGPSSTCRHCGGPCADGSGDCGECR